MDQTGRFKGVLFLGAGLLIGLLLAAGVLFASMPGGTQNAPPATGKAIPEFSLQTLEGVQLQKADLLGQPVVINFWATWCPPCLAEMPLLEQTSQTLHGKVKFLAINFDEDPQLVSQFAQEYGLTMPILLDPGGIINSRFYVQSYPTTFFMDAEGILRAQHIGQLSDAMLSQYLEAAGYTP